MIGRCGSASVPMTKEFGGVLWSSLSLLCSVGNDGATTSLDAHSLVISDRDMQTAIPLIQREK
jgi:hypothetical protein